jgi:hypothetical protein
MYHAAKLTPKQARILAEQSVKLHHEQQAAQQQQAEAAKAEREATVRRETAELQRDWGVDWDRKDQAAGRAIKVLGLDQEALAAIVEKAGYKKAMQAFAAIGGSVGEAAFHAEMGTAPGGMTSPDGARAKIAELSGDRDFQAKLMSQNRSVAELARREWENLHKLAFGAQ